MPQSMTLSAVTYVPPNNNSPSFDDLKRLTRYYNNLQYIDSSVDDSVVREEYLNKVKDVLERSSESPTSSMSSEAHADSMVEIMSVFVKANITWTLMPDIFKNKLLDLLGQTTITRRISKLVYLLGESGFVVDIETFATSKIYESINISSRSLDSYDNHGILRLLQGLAKMKVRWDDLPERFTTNLLIEDLPTRFHSLKPQEFCILMQTLATMKVRWRCLPSEFRSKLGKALRYGSSTYIPRELVAIVRSLGRIHYESDEDDILRPLLSQLASQISNLAYFDFESLFVGLGLLEIRFETLPQAFQAQIVLQVSNILPRMNIFCLHNTMWGMARMGVNRNTHLPSSLSNALFARCLATLHQFIPERQFSDIIWALGTMKYHVRDLDRSQKDRLLAVTSRVLLRLSPNDVGCVLWGLAKLGYRWSEDFLHPVRSIEQGNATIPLGITTIKKLRNCASIMQPNDIGLLIYSLGELRMQWSTLSGFVASALSKRVFQLSENFESRSLANTVFGLGRCGASWNNISVEMRVGLSAALICKLDASVTESSTAVRGLKGMNAVEVAQTVYGLGLARANLRSFSEELQMSLLSRANEMSSEMTPHGRSSCLWGLAAMNITTSDLQYFPNLVSSVVRDVLDIEGFDCKDGQEELARRYYTSLHTIARLQIPMTEEAKNKMRSVSQRLFPRGYQVQLLSVPDAEQHSLNRPENIDFSAYKAV